jgi:hypothetical protein
MEHSNGMVIALPCPVERKTQKKPCIQNAPELIYRESWI